MTRVRVALAFALAFQLEAQDETPTPTPTPSAPPRLVGALESKQGAGTERTALFDDGTLVHVVTMHGQLTTLKRTITTNERDVVAHVCSDAWKLEGETEFRSLVADTSDLVRYRLEIGDPESARVRTFAFDALAHLPLAIGRARGALDDLRDRFLKKPDPKDFAWNNEPIKVGDPLKRRSDGRWFRVKRDDSFEKNLEVEEIGGSGMRLFLPREELPMVFIDPEDAGRPPASK